MLSFGDVGWSKDNGMLGRTVTSLLLSTALGSGLLGSIAFGLLSESSLRTPNPTESTSLGKPSLFRPRS